LAKLVHRKNGRVRSRVSRKLIDRSTVPWVRLCGASIQLATVAVDADNPDPLDCPEVLHVAKGNAAGADDEDSCHGSPQMLVTWAA
jgi:hypothetical protein